MNVRNGWILRTTAALAATAGLVAVSAVQAAEPTTQPAGVGPAATGGFPFVGSVKGTNVRIRSGPDANYYPVRKAEPGEEVTVYEQQYDWLAIAPPKGCYSLIDREYVDKTAEGVGVVNGDDVWVRAGSDMDPQHRYAKQVKLRKGTEVQILGETPDGAFYKITPPEGARLWISAQFVTRGSGAAARPVAAPAERTKPTSGAPAGRTERPRVTVSKTTTTQPGGTSPFGKYADEIQAIDNAIAAETKKPAGRQDYKPILEKLRPIADQDEEPVAQVYAQRRIDQILTKSELTSLVQTIATMKETVDKEHEAARLAREAIRRPPEKLLDGRVSATGEFRPSAIFDSHSSAFPKRYRLVDPSNDKTVAYVELPAGSQIDVDQHLGKYVTVLARERKLTAGTVQPLSVLLADEIRPAEPKGFSPGLVELPGGAPAGGPTTRPVPENVPPATRPSGE